MTSSLLDRWCPEPHEAPITAVAYDPRSGTVATADESGLVVVFADGGLSPTLMIERPAPVRRALALSRGGGSLAIGDEAGNLVVLRTSDGVQLYADERGGGPDRSDPRAGARAVRAVVFSPDGRSVASLSLDGRVRLVSVDRGTRIATFGDFSGTALDWDATGTWLLATDRVHQPSLIDLSRKEKVGFPLIPGGTSAARFTHDGRYAILLGDGGLTLVDVADQTVRDVRSADRSSGMLDLVVGPDPDHVAVLSARSIHYFRIEGLRHVGKQRHSARETTGVALWDARGVAVADQAGRLHRPDLPPPLPGTVCVFGRGNWRLTAHEHQLTVWRDHRRLRVFIPRVVGQDEAGRPSQRDLAPNERLVELAMDAEGRVMALLPEGMPLHVYEASSARLLFDAGPESVDTPRVEVAIGVVALLLESGGLRWFDLRNNRTFELDWVRDFAITGGGSWLAVLTPRGRIRMLDPKSGEDALPALEPFGDAPARLLSFVHRRPELLVLDEEGVLGLYDLLPAARDGGAPEVHRILQFHDVEIDALWGLADGRHAVVRIQEPDSGTATLVTIDLDAGKVVHEVRDLLPYVTLDPGEGAMLEPARGNALLERALSGEERRVLRSLPGGEWLAFEAAGVLERSTGAAAWMDEPT
jgi:hypothetical protein